MAGPNEEMDFREGGRWLYAMISRESVAHWSLLDLIKIEGKSNSSTKSSFCDENGNPIDTGFTSSLTKTSFKGRSVDKNNNKNYLEIAQHL